MDKRVDCKIKMESDHDILHSLIFLDPYNSKKADFQECKSMRSAITKPDQSTGELQSYIHVQTPRGNKVEGHWVLQNVSTNLATWYTSSYNLVCI